MTRAATVAVLLAVVLAGCMGGPSAAPTTSTPTPSAEPVPTTTAPTSTPTTTLPKWPTEGELPPDVSIDRAVVTNETMAKALNATAPVEAVSVTIRYVPRDGTPFALATNCSEYREPFTVDRLDTVVWDVVTNETHNVSEWGPLQVARVDTGEVVATHGLDGEECSPPIPDPEEAE